MNAAQLFKIASALVLPGWLLLIIFPRWQWTDKIITGVIVALLAAAYIYCIAQVFTPGTMKSFGTLDGVMKLFTNETAVLAGWIHYLAFDLMTGLFETKNAQKHNIHHLLVIPCLFLTFMFGPAGLLLYLIIRVFVIKKYFAANY
ncbi:MAG: DUF4281 domain-containing protein [Aquabacterium sp.]|nr:DUF4281 domain-containing protein [Ferruginibacter sp.]